MADVKRKDAGAARREMTLDELTGRLAEARAEKARLRFRSSTESIENPMQFRYLRREIARLATELRARRDARAD